jgi:hypothetical protein
MNDKDSELSDDQMAQLNTRYNRANSEIERLLSATPTVPETGGGRGHGSGNDLGPTDPDQWTEPGAVVCPEWDGISFPVAPRNMSTASKNQIVCYINDLRTYRGHTGITQIELDIVDDLLEEALIARARAP